MTGPTANGGATSTKWRQSLIILIATVWVMLFVYGSDLNRMRLDHSPDIGSSDADGVGEVVFRRPRPRPDPEWALRSPSEVTPSGQNSVGHSVEERTEKTKAEPRVHPTQSSVNVSKSEKQSPLSKTKDENSPMISKENPSMLTPSSLKNTTKTMLYFTPYFGHPAWEFGSGGPEHFEAQGCKVTDCFVTNDYDFMKDFSRYDAILFHIRNMPKRFSRKVLGQRRPEQRYAMMLMESPMNDDADYKQYKSEYCT